MAGAFPGNVPVLIDDMVTLRAHTPDDLDPIVQQSNDPEQVRWTQVPQPYGREQAEHWLGIIRAGWDEDGDHVWAVETPDEHGTRRYAGSVDLRPRGTGVVEVGYGLHPWARGGGVMARAVRLAAAYTFDQEATESIRWRALLGNWGSRRVAWATGFRIEHGVRDLLEHRGAWADGWIGSLRRSEPMRPRTRWLTPPVLEGRAVRLRPWSERDRPAPGWGSDRATERFTPGLVPRSEGYDGWLTGRRERAAAGEALTWCVADMSTDRPVGLIGCFRLDHALTAGNGEVAYWVHESMRGTGVTDEALRLLSEYAFRAEDGGGLGLRRLGAATDVGNRASSRVLVRNGFRPVGVERSLMAHPEGATDGPLFELLATEGDHPARVPLTAPRLERDGLRLRPWSDRDRPAEGLEPDEAALRFMPPGAQPTHERFPGWLATRQSGMDRGETVYWAIADAATDEALGSVAVFRIDQPDAGNGELGYWLYPAARGRGLVPVAIGMAVDHALRARADGGLGMRRLGAVTVKANVASQLWLIRAGFTRVGLERRVFSGDPGTGQAEPQDSVLFELLAEDHPAAGKTARALELTVPTLSTADFRLRAWAPRDVPRIVEACSDPRTQLYLDALPTPYTESDARSYLQWCVEQAARGRGVSWCVADAASDQCLAVVSVSEIKGPDGSGEVGYWAHPRARGRGLTTAAVRLAVRHAVVPRSDGGLGRRRLSLYAAATNAASQHVAETAGFQLAGVGRRAKTLRDGTVTDLLSYDLLAEEVGPPL